MKNRVHFTQKKIRHWMQKVPSNLIQIFGGVDIILICSYSIVFIIDRQRHQNTLQIENEIIYVSENNLLYDDIEIIVSPDG